MKVLEDYVYSKTSARQSTTVSLLDLKEMESSLRSMITTKCDSEKRKRRAYSKKAEEEFEKLAKKVKRLQNDFGD